MPGLVGIIGKGPADVRRLELDRMLGCMYKKDQFESGTYVDEKRGIFVGWTCHKNSYSDCLPIASASSEKLMFFAGEHYPIDEEESRIAKQHGCPSDRATVLLPLYQRKGDAFFGCLNGFFHGLIIDRQKDQVILFNDRFGMQRLYYVEEPDVFYFASEAKSLLAIRDRLRSFDPKGLGEWLSCGAVLENRSLFKEIVVLPGGARWTWDPGASCEKRQYFSPRDWESLPQIAPEAFYRKLRAIFQERLSAYLTRRQVRVGMATTGGLDTRMILANVKIDRDALTCYSFCGPVRENLDVSIGRRVAHAAGFDHATLTINKTFFDRFGQLARDVILSTDGNLDLSGVPEAFLNEMSQEISPIRLTGNYGGEVLRRYRSFEPTDSICEVLNDELAESVINAVGSWAYTRQGHPLTDIVFKQIPWFSYNRLQFEQAALIMRSPFMDNALLEVVYQAPAECIESKLISLRLIHDGNPLLGEILTDRGVSYPRRPSWPLTRAYFELIFKLEYYASHGMPKRFATIDRRLGVFSLERNFLGRNKYYHLRQWFRDELASYVRDILMDHRTLSREYLDREKVIQTVKKHLAGVENATDTIDKMIAIELTNRFILEATYPMP